MKSAAKKIQFPSARLRQTLINRILPVVIQFLIRKALTSLDVSIGQTFSLLLLPPNKMGGLAQNASQVTADLVFLLAQK
jgi:hypothetical protein